MLNNLSEPFTLILGIAVILLTGLLFSKIAKLIRVPDVTGYLLGGLVIGPVFLNLIMKWIFKVDFPGFIGKDFVDGLRMFATIELAFIAFTVGSEFKISYFKQVGIMPVVIAFAESFAAVIFITGGMLIFGLPLPFALAMGAVGGATAPAATILVIRQYKAKGDLAKTTMSVVAIDDASALIFFGIAIAIVKALIMPSTQIVWTIMKPFIEIISSLALGVVIGFLFTFIMSFFKGRGNRTCLTIAMLFVIIGICELLKAYVTIPGAGALELSSLLACMGMGAIFTNFSSKTCEEVMPLIERITPPFVIIFFVLSGADLQLSSLTWVTIGVLAIYLVFRIAGKIFGTFASAKACKAPPKIQKWLGWGLLPQGGIAIGLSVIVMETFKNAFESNPDLLVLYPKLEIFNGDFVRIIVILAVFVSEIFGPLCLKYALIKSGEGVLPTRKEEAVKA